MIEIVLFGILFLATVVLIGYILSYSTDKLDEELKDYYDNY